MEQHTPTTERLQWLQDFWNPAAAIVARHRPWFHRESSKHLHPAAHWMLSRYAPRDWQQLLLEWPYQATTDPTKLAFTRDERSGEADRQTLTSPGKYLRRHWPDVPDHVIRNAVAAASTPVLEFLTTTAGIVMSAQLGPATCMRWQYGPDDDDDDGELVAPSRENILAALKAGDLARVDWDSHPYCVYSPALGWSAAVLRHRDDPRLFAGRALVWTSPEGRRYFVRTFCGDPTCGGWSPSHHGLETELTAAGVAHVPSWPCGTPLRRVEHPTESGLFFPYLDGGVQRVRDIRTALVIDADGEYDCTNTDGTAAEPEEADASCEDCGADIMFDAEEHTYVGRYEDHLVCDSCLRRNYTLVNAHTTNPYYLKDDDVVEVSGVGDYVDPDNLPNGIEEVDDRFGNSIYADFDDCVFVGPDGVHRYLPDLEQDPRFIECSEPDPTTGNTWWLRSQTWTCAHTGRVYPNTIESEEADGETYHPDTLRELREATQLPLIKEAA